MIRSLFALGFILFSSLPSIAQGDFKAYDDGIAKFRSGDYQGVIDAFSAILNDPKHSKKLDEDLYYYRGQSFYHTGNIDNAIADLDESLRLNHYQKGVILWYKARCADKKGNKVEAEDLYDQALTAAEKNKKVTARILADRSQFLSRHGNTAGAKADLEKAKALDPAVPALAGQKVAQGKDEQKTQVIVKQNPSRQNASVKPKPQAERENTVKKEKADGQIKLVPEQAESSTNSVSVVSALAQTYKDEKRFALVIGNGSYNKEIGLLKNPVNDATDIATELRKSDFDVQLLTNATYVQIREAMRKFQDRLASGPKDQTVGLFYYAGHGVQYQDENYLVPIDANVKYEDDIVRMCFPVQRMVLNNMENTNSRMNIIILDACRNNPFPATTRSVGGGLAEMKRARGSFIAYATAPGSVASDGVGRNGLYTQELLKALRKPGLTIEQVFKEVRMNVLKMSGEKQYTWDSSNIIGEFYFKF